MATRSTLRFFVQGFFRVLQATLIPLLLLAPAVGKDGSPGGNDKSVPVTQTNSAALHAGQPSPQAPAPRLADANQMLQRQGPIFIENRGQFDRRVKFLVTGNGANLWLTNEGIVFDFQRPASKQSANAAEEKAASLKRLSPGHEPIDPRQKSDQPPMERLVFKQKLVNPNPNPTIEARDPQPGIYNYFPTSDPDTWRTHVLAYKEVVYHDIWKGIDLKLFANGPNLEEEFIVHPGADASAVRLAYEGIEGLSVADDGSLKVATAFGDIVETSPRIYQEIAGNTVPLSGSFKVGAQNSYAFEVAKRDEKADLIIDPTVVFSKPRDSRRAPSGNPPLYSSFLGGSQYDIGNAIAVDNAGNAYITGQTNSTDFPTMGAYQGSGTGVFITKVNALGSAPLVYSTYLGQAARGFGIAVDSSGSAYVVGGYTNPNFPTTANAYDQAPCGAFGQGGSAFFTKLSPAGDALIYSTCLGQGAIAYAVAVDAAGNAYLTGAIALTYGSLPTTAGAYQPSDDPNTQAPAFLSVINPSASGAPSLVYSTYFGGSHSAHGGGPPTDQGNGIAVDSFGMAYLTGFTTSSDFPVTGGAYLTTYPGNNNCTGGALTAVPCPSAFIAKFNPQASGVSSLLYSTYLGGVNTTIGQGIAVDSLGNAYVGGHTGYDSLWGWCGATCTPAFPTTQGAYQTVPDTEDAFVTKLNAAGNNLIYSTLLGGSAGHGQQAAAGVALDATNDAYVAGWTNASNFPPAGNAYLPTDPNPAFQQGFVTQFNSTGTGLLYSSYLGGTMGGTNGDGGGIAVDQVGDAYVTGNTYAIDFPITLSPFQPAYAGNGDAFVTKFPIGNPVGISVSAIFPNTGGNAGQVTPVILGTGFHLGATTQLNCGVNQVPGTNLTVTGDGRILEATFDLTSSSPGTCDVVVTNSDQTSAKLTQGFTIQQGGAPLITVDLVGLHNVIPGHEYTYYAIVRNQGTIDSSDAVLLSVYGDGFGTAPTQIANLGVIGVPVGGPIDLRFPLSKIGLDCNELYGDWTQKKPEDMNCDQLGQLIEFIANAIRNTGLTPILNQSMFRACTLYHKPPKSCGSCPAGCRLLPGDQFQAACGDASSRPVDHRSVLAWRSSPDDGSGECTLEVCGVHSADPNDKDGLSGVGTQRYISGATACKYSVSFSNDGTAPAQRVLITDQLALTDDEVGTVSLGPISYPNGFVVPPPFQTTFSQLVDLRPANNLLLEIDASLDRATGLLSWNYQSLDPITHQPPIDPGVGFLPPGTNGNVFVGVSPIPNLPTNTQIQNQAIVTFDSSQPMPTPIWLNTLDNTPPTSHVTAFSGNQLCPNFTVQWSGTDIGSGIANYTIYVSDNGGAFTAWQTNTTSTSAVYNGQVGHSYGFYSIAQDLVGNIEPGKSSAEATTQVNKGTICGPVGPPTVIGGR